MTDPIDGFKALAHPLRYRILTTLADGEHNVGAIEEASGITQPALSQQLAVLRKAGLVTTRKDAKQVYYEIDRGHLQSLAAALGQLSPQGDTAAVSKPSRTAKGTPRRGGAAVFARLGN